VKRTSIIIGAVFVLLATPVMGQGTQPFAAAQAKSPDYARQPITSLTSLASGQPLLGVTRLN